MREVRIAEPDAAWSARFAEAAAEFARALESVVAVHHIGSTSVPDLPAKPVIDLLVEVEALAEVDARGDRIAALGYEVLGEYGLPGRRYFRRDDAAGERTHHVHLWQTGHADVARHLAFRDYLIAHPAVAREYGVLKRDLARAHPRDMDAYIAGKDAWVRRVETEALAWWRASRER